MSAKESVVVTLTTGKSDNGKMATIALSCALSALALESDTTLFLTSDGSVWGYEGSAKGIVVQGFPPLEDMLAEFLAGGGRLLMCSVCHKTCGVGGPEAHAARPLHPGASVAGFATVVELAKRGTTFTF
ncbi:MAG: DsrE family protein [Planctomycetales bacterium]|nr:DsrE family protein [Planctomycetales bacterium]